MNKDGNCYGYNCGFIRNDGSCGDYQNEKRCSSPLSYMNKLKEEKEVKLVCNMNLRDWFAGQALAGIASNVTKNWGKAYADIADQAYSYADAMLTARDCFSFAMIKKLEEDKK